MDALHFRPLIITSKQNDNKEKKEAEASHFPEQLVEKQVDVKIISVEREREERQVVFLFPVRRFVRRWLAGQKRKRNESRAICKLCVTTTLHTPGVDGRRFSSILASLLRESSSDRQSRQCLVPRQRRRSEATESLNNI